MPPNLETARAAVEASRDQIWSSLFEMRRDIERITKDGSCSSEDDFEIAMACVATVNKELKFRFLARLADDIEAAKPDKTR